MPKYSYPGVYVQEVPGGERSVTGVSTAITAFVGYTARGKLNEAARVLNFADYERQFGGLHPQSEISYAVRQYFLNGGTEAVVVRTATGAGAASVIMKNGTAGDAPEVLEIRAASEGTWGNNLRVQVDYATSNPDSFFNVVVGEYREGSTAPVNQEVFRNLSMNPGSPMYAPAVMNAASKLVRAESKGAENSLTDAAKGYSQSGDLTAFPALTNNDRFLMVSINGEGPYLVEAFPKDGGGAVTDLTKLKSSLETAIRKVGGTDAYKLATVTVVGSTLKITAGTGGKSSAVVVTAAPTASATAKLKLGLAAGGRETEAAAIFRPAQNGSVSKELTTVPPLTKDDQTTLALSVGSVTVTQQSFKLGAAPTTVVELAAALQTQIRAADPTNARLKGLTVRTVGNRLQVLPSAEMGEAVITFADGTGESLVTKLELTAGGANVQWYALGSPVSAMAQNAGQKGNDGTAPTVTDLLGSEAAKSGLYALENTDLFNLLCIPRMAQVLDPAIGETGANQIIAEAMAYCERRRAFLLVDAPETIATPTAMEEWIRKAPRHKNAAIYFPQVMVADPLSGYRLKALPPSGTVAGVYARTDATRGVWKVPAGVDASLMGVQALSCNLTDGENGKLNELAVNCIRNFPVYGQVIWGARTLAGADEMVSEWKYVGVRRLSLYIEESLYRGTKWVVFEPNDEQLWSQIRLSVGSFMNRLFRQGAFQGSPQQAYFVQCDSSVTTQDDISQGVVNIMIGFSPLKPAEFVVLQLQQIAGQAQA